MTKQSNSLAFMNAESRVTMRHIQTMIKAKETTASVVYKPDKMEAPVIAGQIYIQKWAIHLPIFEANGDDTGKSEYPDKIIMTLEF
jgi:hypothetical protein